MDKTVVQPEWPALPLESWKDTYETLHMWMQAVGKVDLALSPRINHWWESTFHLNSFGLTTAPIPYDAGIFEIQFNFIHHRLVIHTSQGTEKTLGLRPRSVASFYEEFMSALQSLGIHVKIWTMPVEIPDPIAFDKDEQHAAYDAEYANRFWRILVLVDPVFNEFRGRFIGKSSPVHFFWGSCDLAVTRFSGRRAPEKPGADAITREAYSHEVISAGFWPGSGPVPEPAFYCYAAPEPPGFADGDPGQSGGFYHGELKEFVLRYEDVRQAVSPRNALMEFLESTYAAGATAGGWDRKNLERPS